MNPNKLYNSVNSLKKPGQLKDEELINSLIEIIRTDFNCKKKADKTLLREKINKLLVAIKIELGKDVIISLYDLRQCIKKLQDYTMAKYLLFFYDSARNECLESKYIGEKVDPKMFLLRYFTGDNSITDYEEGKKAILKKKKEIVIKLRQLENQAANFEIATGTIMGREVFVSELIDSILEEIDALEGQIKELNYLERVISTEIDLPSEFYRRKKIDDSDLIIFSERYILALICTKKIISTIRKKLSEERLQEMVNEILIHIKNCIDV